jgi:predicted transcriptional regulator
LVEFRRSRIASDVSTVIVYATKPVGRIIGWFEVEEVVEGTPLALWRRFSSAGAIDRSSYLTYFREADRAFGIKVRRAKRFRTPRTLEQLHPGLRAPQSFQYVSASALSELIAV